MTITMPLTKGYETIIDDKDAYLAKHKWYAHRGGGGVIYAARRLKISEDPDQPLVLMHRIITNCPENLEVDHIDGDSLNNTRGNLRLGTHLQNARNMRVGEQRGVSKVGNKWRAQITLNRKTIHLGYHPTKREALEAYNKASKKYHGRFGNLNELEKQND